MNEFASTYLLMYELNAKVCGFMKGLLSMCGVMGLHMSIALVYYDLGHEQGVIKMYMQRSKYMCDWCSSR